MSEKDMDGNTFPKGFLWGAATSSHQVEGDNDANDWADWETAGRAKERSGMACDHWRRFREDFDLARSLGHNAHRFSIEWSRIEPQEGQFNEAALLHYCEVVDALRERNLEPVVTLHHFTLPRWVAREGGWISSRFVQYFLRYADRVAEYLSDKVRYWVTVNEPMVALYQGYIQGIWPPGEKSFGKALEMFRNVVRVHTELYHMLHNRRRNCWVGMAKHVRAFFPYRSFWPFDHLSAGLRQFFFSDLMTHILTTGVAFFPGLENSFLRRAKGTTDFIGVNYYTREFVKFALTFPFGGEKEKSFSGETGERNSLGWEIYPEGLYRALVDLRKFSLPIIILENGLCTLEDPRRIVFIQSHLGAVARAMKAGADIRGYFYWSLVDNFEWLDGFEPRFGLVEMDYKTQARRPRPSAEYYAGICRTGKIT
ncbi:MAG: glycoside hydrolase family 1 protein [Candidatus Omnitrophica bacterium]|nr:glycoside hydrolase family 1 protein [Candidatus Omnitrophota bacterium]